MEKKSKYFGSVRFYKNMILLAVVLAIGVGAFFAFLYHGKYNRLLEHRAADSESGVVELEADGPGYQSLLPGFYSTEEYGATKRKTQEAYLTFNIVSYSQTEQILKVLEEQDVKATFFVTGSSEIKDATILQEISDAGHTIGMLSWSKDYAGVYESVESYLEDMYQIYTFIHDSTGTYPTVFRFLGGSINSYNGGIYQQLVAEMIRRGFVPYDWNVSLQGEQVTPTAKEQVARVTTALEQMDRIVILIQDTQDQAIMLEALPGIIQAIQAAEFEVKPLTPDIKPILFAYSS